MMRSLSLVSLVLLGACSPNLTPYPEREDYKADDSLTLPCLPNLDGQITAIEASPSFGAVANYLVSPAGATRSVDLRGKDNGDDTFLWDFSTDDASDQALRTGPTRVSERWYASSFPESAFVAALDAAGVRENVLSIDDSALKLLGVASREEDGPNGKTLLVYDPPIDLYRFPLEVGTSYESRGVIRNGLFNNIPYAGEDVYRVEVDGAGEVRLPDLIATHVLRVRITALVTPAAGTQVLTQQTSFMAECLGEIMRATSAVGEENRDFDEASEVRRLGLFP